MRHPNVNPVPLANAIRKTIEEKGISRSELAQLSGANTGQICKILNSDFGRASMRVQRICEVLGIDWAQYLPAPARKANVLSSEVNAFINGDPRREKAVASMLQCFKSLCEGPPGGSVVDIEPTLRH